MRWSGGESTRRRDRDLISTDPKPRSRAQLTPVTLLDGQGASLLAPTLLHRHRWLLRGRRHPVFPRRRTQCFLQLRRSMGVQAPQEGQPLPSLSRPLACPNDFY